MDGYYYPDGWSFENDVPSEESISYSSRDYTPEFCTDQIFESRGEMIDWAKNVGLENGIVVVIKNSANLKGGKLPKCILGCERGGKYKPHRGGVEKQILHRNTGTKKCDCPFDLRGIPIPPDGAKWGLKVSCGVHNHEPAENFEGHEYPSRLKPMEKQFVVEMGNSTAPREILSILKQKDPSNTTGIRSIYNAISINKEKKRGGLNQTQYVLDQLIKKGYLHDFITNQDTNEITDIVWVHPTCLELSVTFSKVLVIDATYKTNEYRKPLLEVVGMTSTNLSYSLMFAYLNNETTERVTWALDTLKKWMVGKGALLPLVCVTDRDLALMKAIEACFPTAHHILCIWHINQCVMKKCSAALGDKLEDFYHSWQSLINSSTTLSYQQKWTAMCEEYSQYPGVITYVADTWLRPYRNRFIKAWTNTYMHLGSNSSQRAEVAHARLKKYLKNTSMSSLQTSFDCIEKMLTNEFGEIKKSFEKSLNIPRHTQLRDDFFGEIRCRISLYAMEQIQFQLASAADAYPLPGGCCGCSIKTTHGLPCMHDLACYHSLRIPIPISSIDVHWRRLSMHADGFNDEGEQPDETSRVVGILQAMSPCARKHMISRIVNMADPSQSSVRAPSYNTEHGGRPVGKAEQSARRIPSCTEASTSSSRAASALRGRGKGRGRGRGMAREREEVDYIQYLPGPFRQYMSHTKDVIADGHCGFRAIAAQIYDTEEDWAQVRHDLIEEIIQNKDLYKVLYPQESLADELLTTLNYFRRPASREYYMDSMSMGVVIASRYNIVLHTFDTFVGGCYTHLPLRSPPVPVQHRKEIAIARINNNHFVQLFLHPQHPLPLIPMWWWEHASDEAKGWAMSYDLNSWFQLLGVVPGSQFGGNVD